MRIIDKYFLGLLIFFLQPCKLIGTKHPHKRLIHPKKILIIRLWAMGSTLLSFPMIKQLKLRYGDKTTYEILCTSRNISVVKGQGYFSRILNLFNWKDFLSLIMSFKKYDIVVDCEEYFRISSLLSLRLGKISVGYSNIFVRKIAYTYSYQYLETQHNLINCLGLIEKIGVVIKIPETMEPLVYKENDTVRVNHFFQSLKGNKVICMHAGGAETSPDRFWDKKNWINLIDVMINKYSDIHIVLTGGKFEESTNQYIVENVNNSEKVTNIAGKFGLFEFAYLLEKCDLMISNDTGPMHLAAAMGTRTIGLFGPNQPRIFGPWPLGYNYGLYKGDGTIYIKPHKGIFTKDRTLSINNIGVQDIVQICDKYM